MKTFHIEGWGDVGESNLEFGVIAITSGRDWHDIEIGESCVVETKDHKFERVVRLT
jgi:hypothetical protein